MKGKIKSKIILAVVVVLSLAVYSGVCASKSLVAIGKANFEAEISTASYIAIGKTLDSDVLNGLYEAVMDKDGNVVMISSNALKLNFLSKTLAEECLKSYSILANGGVKVPTGALTGISFLSGLGKPIDMKLVTVKSVKCEFVSKFESAGINQTKQSLYLKIIPDCVAVAGLYKQSIVGEIEYLCYENYVIGKVPEAYLNVTSYVAK